MSKEAMKLALEALLSTYPTCCWDQYAREQDAITALREALADQTAPAQQCMEHGECFGGECIYPATQPAQQEPVAWRAWFDADNGARWLFSLWPEEERLDVEWQPLYTSPQAQPAQQDRVRELECVIADLKAECQALPAQRKPLTDEQIADILPDDDTPMSLGEAFVKFARAIEAAHGIKENT